jgi:hypothetical protein
LGAYVDLTEALTRRPVGTDGRPSPRLHSQDILMKELARILSAIDQGEPHAAEFVSSSRLVTPR